jgi:DNA topoisomerase I
MAITLTYVFDDEPGLTRSRGNGSFLYFYPDGRPVRSPRVVKRINSLAIPPAYTDVWICRNPRGHIQATGRDARGRKQYRYHPEWDTIRHTTKYERMLAFGKALPGIRRRVAALLKQDGMSREKVLAAVVKLLEITLIRVGNDEYARTNKSYGLTTLQTRHVEIAGRRIHFSFRGKGGLAHAVTVEHPRLALIVRHCKALPGSDLFQYLDEGGNCRAISAADVNGFLQQISGADFTAKDYRTWAGSVFVMSELRKLPFTSEKEAKKNIVATIKAVAERLGNTPAVCRKSYVHPVLLDAYRTGALEARRPGMRTGIGADEADFLRFLKLSPRVPVHPRKERVASAPSASARYGRRPVGASYLTPRHL